MAFSEQMRKISKPTDHKGIAGIVLSGKRTYRGGVNNPVSGPRTIPGGYASLLRPVNIETRGRPKKRDSQRTFPVSVIQERLLRGFK